MLTLSVKLPKALAAKLNALVRRRRQSKSDLVREAIERLVSEQATGKKQSVHDLLKDLKGVVRGPKDLSANKKYFEGYGK